MCLGAAVAEPVEEGPVLLCDSGDPAVHGGTESVVPLDRLLHGGAGPPLPLPVVHDTQHCPAEPGRGKGGI